MHLSIVDAFTRNALCGKQAAVALVDQFPDDIEMQLIAREMNLPATAFVAGQASQTRELRWFTPAKELSLCVHGTIAAAHEIGGAMTFATRAGPLVCTSHDQWIEVDVPVVRSSPRAIPDLAMLNAAPLWSGLGGDSWLVELPAEEDVLESRPDAWAVESLGRRLVITARSLEPDFDIISRVFTSDLRVPEDAASGSAHQALGPYWAARLGSSDLLGYQASPRGGIVKMHLADDRIALSGQAITVAELDVLHS